MEVLYTAEATATGGRKNGRAWSSDGAIDVQINPPKEVGGSGEGTNPEQLFAAGYAACFDNALASVARMEKLAPGQTTTTALVALATHPEGGFALDVELRVAIPDLPAPRPRTSSPRPTSAARTQEQRAGTWRFASPWSRGLLGPGSAARVERPPGPATPPSSWRPRGPLVRPAS